MLTKKISLFFITMFFIQSNESERIHAFFYKNTLYKMFKMKMVKKLGNVLRISSSWICKVKIHFVKKAHAIGKVLFCVMLSLLFSLSFIFSFWVGKVMYSPKNVPVGWFFLLRIRISILKWKNIILIKKKKRAWVLVTFMKL